MELRIPPIENLAEHSYSTYNFALRDCHFKTPGVAFPGSHEIYCSSEAHIFMFGTAEGRMK